MQQLTKFQDSPGTWFNSKTHVPPNQLVVLCCTKYGDLVFAYFSNSAWSNPCLPDAFAWQVVSQPTPIFFDF